MQISCPQCQAQYNVDEGRIPPQGVSINCPRCKHSFVVQAPGAAAAVPLPGGGGAVPLPGQRAGGAVPLPGQRAGGAVPLPGAGGGGAVPLPGAGAGGAGPWPGAGAGVPLPRTGRGGAVPLPGTGKGAAVPVPLPGTGGMKAACALPSMEDIFGTAPSAAPPPSAPAPAPTGSRSMSIGDIFGDAGGDPAGDSRPPHPFHGQSTLGPSAGAPDPFGFMADAGAPTAPPREESFQIRKRSGRVLGPLSTTQVLTMFHKGELLGSEEASIDGVTWRPLAQIGAFAETIQKAMASALAGLDDLPVPKGSGFEDLPAPRGAGLTDLPSPRGAGLTDLPSPRGDGLTNLPSPRGAGRTASGELLVDTNQLLDAEKAKINVERRRAGGRATKTPIVLAAAMVVLVIVAAGVALNFVTDYGYFGLKLLFKDEEKVVEKKPVPVEEAPPPVALPQVDQDFDTLLADDAYLSYRQGAEQAGKTVEAGKAVAPFPASAKKAAAQQARFLAYLIAVDELVAFLPQLRAVLPLAEGDEVGKAIGEAASAYGDRQWEKGMAAVKPLTETAKTPEGKAEAWVFLGLGHEGKGELNEALAAYDSALQVSTRKLVALYLQARALAAGQHVEPALEYANKALSQNAQHPRANLLKGKLLAMKAETADEGKKLLAEVSEGKLGESAAPAQRSQAYIGRAEVALTAGQNTEGLRYLQRGVELVPQNRQVREQAAELALRLRDYDAALTNAQALLEMNPDEMSGVILVARAKMGARDPLSAYSDLQSATRKWPDSAAVAYWFGVAAREMSKLDEARKYFEKAVTLDPKGGQAVVELVYDLIEQGKLTEAVKRATEAEDAVGPMDAARVRAAKAFAYARRRQFEQGEKEYKKALEQNPKDTDTRARYATMLLQMHRVDEAERQVNDALLVDAKNPAVIVASGDVLAARTDFKAALGKYEQAMQLAPNAFQPYLHAAVAAIELKDQTRAKGFVDTAGQLRPNVAEVLAMQGLVLKQTDPKSAERLLKQAMDLAPEEPAYPYQLGVVNQAMGAPLEAIDALKKATSIDPDFVDAYFSLAKTQRDLGRIKDAKESLDACVRIDPKRSDAWLELADILGTQDDDAGALKAYERALKANPGNAASVCAMGETLVVRLGTEAANLKRGITVLENCVRLAPKHATAWKNLGNAYKTINKKGDAIRAYRTHIAANPDDVENLIIQDFIKDLGG